MLNRIFNFFGYSFSFGKLHYDKDHRPKFERVANYLLKKVGYILLKREYYTEAMVIQQEQEKMGVVKNRLKLRSDITEFMKPEPAAKPKELVFPDKIEDFCTDVPIETFKAQPQYPIR